MPASSLRLAGNQDFPKREERREKREEGREKREEGEKRETRDMRQERCVT